MDLARLTESVLKIDPDTAVHVRAIAARGAEFGRNRHAFGLVGDSMTVSNHFFRPFSQDDRMKYELAPEVRRTLLTPIAGAVDVTIIDYYRIAEVERYNGKPRDSFGAFRAAAVGVRANWPLQHGEASPLVELINRVNPAVAIVAYGGNDAAYRPSPPEVLADTFESNFLQLLNVLEQSGVVPILTTLPRHNHQPGVDGCEGLGTNWRIAVATTAISDRIAAIACRQKLPLIDLRHAVDTLPNHGLGPDAVHPSWFKVGGAGMLTQQGLQCGYNVRNYTALLMLKEVKETLNWQ